MFRFVRIAILAASIASPSQSAEYGVDCSFPIHSKTFQCGSTLGDRKTFYEDFMAGCRKHFGRKGNRCDQTEDDRLEMSQRQPMSMVNYTETGFKKIKAPKELFRLLTEHWETNKDKKIEEVW
jgi:prolyl 4-hydroxylase